MVKKLAEKNKDLTVEMQRMWNVNTKVKRMIIKENGAIYRLLKKYPGNILEKRKIKEIQSQPYWAQHTYLGKY